MHNIHQSWMKVLCVELNSGYSLPMLVTAKLHEFKGKIRLSAHLLEHNVLNYTKNYKYVPIRWNRTSSDRLDFFLYCGNTLTPKLCVKLILGGNRQSQKGRNPFQYNSNDRKLAMMAKIIDFLNLLSRTNKSPHKLWGIGRTAKAHFLNWQRTHSI